MSITVCRHEAAHAICAWYFGFEVVRVRILKAHALRAGKPLLDRFGKKLHGAGGHTEYRRKSFSADMLWGSNGANLLRNYAEKRLCVIFAGPIITALDFGRSLRWSFAHGGIDDANMINKVRAFAAVNQKSIHRIVRRTTYFLITPQARRAIEELSSRLLRFSALNGSQIDDLCAAAFRGGCSVNLVNAQGIGGFIDFAQPLASQVRQISLPTL